MKKKKKKRKVIERVSMETFILFFTIKTS